MVEMVAIVAKPKPEALVLARALKRWLEDRAITVLLDETTAGRLQDGTGASPARMREAGLMVVLGGDGTLIHGAQMLQGAEVPIFGVNVGYLGFLTEIAQGEMYERLEPALAGQAPIQERVLLRVELHRDGHTCMSGLVLNDAVLSKAALARIAEITCTIDGRFVADYRVDGIIVSTPTGSTAYNLSAGGPIVYPTMQAMVLTPLCPHTLSQRPLLLPHDSELRLSLKSTNGKMFLTLDGQRGRALKASDEVVVRESRKKAYVVQNPDLDFFQILRQKLGWGG